MKKSLIVFSVVILLISMSFLLTNIGFVSAKDGCEKGDPPTTSCSNCPGEGSCGTAGCDWYCKTKSDGSQDCSCSRVFLEPINDIRGWAAVKAADPNIGTCYIKVKEPRRSLFSGRISAFRR